MIGEQISLCCTTNKGERPRACQKQQSVQKKKQFAFETMQKEAIVFHLSYNASVLPSSIVLCSLSSIIPLWRHLLLYVTPSRDKTIVVFSRLHIGCDATFNTHSTFAHTSHRLSQSSQYPSAPFAELAGHYPDIFIWHSTRFIRVSFTQHKTRFSAR